MKTFTTWIEQFEDYELVKISSIIDNTISNLDDLDKTGGLAKPKSMLFYSAVSNLQKIKKIIDGKPLPDERDLRGRRFKDEERK